MRSAILHVLYLVPAVALAACAGRPASQSSSIVEGPPTAVGPAPLRRLTQEQYRNTVRELFGVKDLGTDLPIDEGTAGFFGNTIAPVSELHLEKYGRAAEVVARTASQRLGALLPCAGASQVADELGCATRFIERFGRRAYRRPLTAEEKQNLVGLFQAGKTTSGFQGGLRLVLEALLQSPHFLYLVEPAPPAAGGPVSMPPFALASRLSYFVWNSTPDEALLQAAETNQLRTREQVAAQTARMMADRRFRDTVASFHLQWLDLTELGAVEKRNKIYPLFTPDMRASMREETVRFADFVVREGDGLLDTLLTGRFSFVDGRLRELYGMPKVTAAAGPAGKSGGAADGWSRVDLTSMPRAGLLTQASVMTKHAHWDQPSLVLRGKLIREQLLCTVLPPPPPDVNNTLPRFDPKVSARERFEDHRSEVSCAKCHRLIDPLGVPFEGYDAIGAVRTMDGPNAVDPTSELSGTKQSDGPVKDALELGRRLSTSQEVRDCVALQWFRYALGREDGPADAGSLALVRQVFKESGYKVPALVAAIPATDSFRYQQPQLPPEPQPEGQANEP
jgi:hypothetical protein